MRGSDSAMPRHSIAHYGIPKAVGISYGAGAPWWWWEARPFDIVTETTTMIVIGIVLNFVGLGFLCWALFALAVYALPFLAGVTAGFAAYHTGAGPIAAILVGLLVGVATLAAGQTIAAVMRSPLIRIPIALLFAVPAAVAGYHATLGLARIGVPAEAWREALALVGAIIVGSTAWARITLSAPPAAGQGVGSAQPPLVPAARDA